MGADDTRESSARTLWRAMLMVTLLGAGTGGLACGAGSSDDSNDSNDSTPDATTTGSSSTGEPEPEGFSPDPRWDRWEVLAPGYAVPTADTTYVCFGVTLTVTQARHVVAFEPVIDHAEVVHHMLVFRSLEALQDLEPCYPGPPAAVMQWGWGPGGQPLVLPEEAGFPVGGEPGLVHYVLQVHYSNFSGLEGIRDHSGIAIYTTTELRPENAGLIGLGDVEGLAIPPGQPQWPTAHWCGSESTALADGPFHVFGSWLHAHELGRALWTEHWRDGVLVGELGRHDPYDFANQTIEAIEAIVEPGDELVTRCVFDSTDQTEPVLGGGGTDEEMCLNYLMIHPAQPRLYICNDA